MSAGLNDLQGSLRRTSNAAALLNCLNLYCRPAHGEDTPHSHSIPTIIVLLGRFFLSLCICLSDCLSVYLSIYLSSHLTTYSSAYTHTHSHRHDHLVFLTLILASWSIALPHILLHIRPWHSKILIAVSIKLPCAETSIDYWFFLFLFMCAAVKASDLNEKL